MSRSGPRTIMGSKDGGGQDDKDDNDDDDDDDDDDEDLVILFFQIGVHIARGVQYLNNQGMFHR